MSLFFLVDTLNMFGKTSNDSFSRSCVTPFFFETGKYLVFLLSSRILRGNTMKRTEYRFPLKEHVQKHVYTKHNGQAVIRHSYFSSTFKTI